jgi:hypothetical protein
MGRAAQGCRLKVKPCLDLMAICTGSTKIQYRLAIDYSTEERWAEFMHLVREYSATSEKDEPAMEYRPNDTARLTIDPSNAMSADYRFRPWLRLRE